jgi:excisionase family DNA binding protein
VAAPVRKVLFSVEEAAVSLSMGRTTVFNLIKDGKLNALKVGKRRLVAATELEAFALRLQQGA